MSRVDSSPEPGPRRRPATSEGEAIVTSILDAAERLLVEEGLERMTTNRIARLAGVSVGSLYQYFPNKVAIVGALGRRLDARSGAAIGEALAPATDVRSAVEALVEALLSRDAVRAVLLTEVPAGWIAEESHTEIRAQLAQILASEPEVREGRTDVMTFVAYHALVSVARAALLQKPELLDDAAFRSELARLALAYLAR